MYMYNKTKSSSHGCDHIYSNLGVSENNAYHNKSLCFDARSLGGVHVLDRNLGDKVCPDL